MTIKEMIAETYEAISDLDISQSDKQVIHAIETLLAELDGKMFSGKTFEMYDARELSRICGSLAILKASLGDILVFASKNADLSEARLSFAKASFRRGVVDDLMEIRKGKTPTVDDINSEIELKITKRRYVAIFRREYADRCLYLWRSINSVIDAINQRIRVLMSDRADVGHYDTTLGFDISSVPDPMQEPTPEKEEVESIDEDPISDDVSPEDMSDERSKKEYRKTISQPDFSDFQQNS